jgi:hypothetical protein
MKVKTLINKLLNYNMEETVELVIYGDEGERYSCVVKDNCVDENGGYGDACPIIFHATEIKDEDKDESLQDLILYKHSLINHLNKMKGGNHDRPNEVGDPRSTDQE